MAVEDIGMADHNALVVANAAKDAYHMLGTPEGELAFAEACTISPSPRNRTRSTLHSVRPRPPRSSSAHWCRRSTS